MNAPFTKESFRLLFQAWAEKSQFYSFSYLWQKLPEYAVLRNAARQNKGMALLILFEELEANPWLALDLIYKTVRADLPKVPLLERGRANQILIRLYRWAIGRGYHSPKIREAYASVREQVEMERDVLQVIHRLNRCRTQKRDVKRGFELACTTLVGIAHRNHELFYDIVVGKHLLWMGLQGKPDDPRLARLFSDVLCLVAPQPLQIEIALTCKEIYEAWFQFGKPSFFKQRIKNLEN